MRVAIFAWFATALIATASAQVSCGDCNADGVISITDALVVAQDAVGAAMVPQAQRPLCDVDTDGALDVLDALLIASATAGLPTSLICPSSRGVLGLRAVSALGASTAYSNVISWAAGGNPLVLVAPGETQALVLEARFLLPPFSTDVAAASNPDGNTAYVVAGSAISCSAGGVLTAGDENGCVSIQATFTPDGIAALGAPVVTSFAACVNLGGPDDAPRGDRSALAVGEIDLTLPGLPDGPVIPALGGDVDVFIEIQAGTHVLGAYQLEIEWSPSAPTLILDPSFGGAGGGGSADFGVSSTDPASGLPLSALDFGPQVTSNNVLGLSQILDLNTTLAPSATGLVRAAVMRFGVVAAGGGLATIEGTIQAVASTAPIVDPSIGRPTPRPLIAGSGTFERP